MKNEKVKVLIVDDEKNVRQELIFQLEDKYEILEAENGKQASEIIKSKEKIAVIILDHDLGDMEAIPTLLNLCQRIRPETYVIVLTANRGDNHKLTKSAFIRGAYDFIDKTVLAKNPDALFLQVKEAVDNFHDIAD